jgi:hypothetical protein
MSAKAVISVFAKVAYFAVATRIQVSFRDTVQNAQARTIAVHNELYHLAYELAEL